MVYHMSLDSWCNFSIPLFIPIFCALCDSARTFKYQIYINLDYM